MTNKAVNDDRGQPIQSGNLVIATSYGGRVPKAVASERGRVVGFTKKGQVKVQFFFEVYDENLSFRSIPPEWLRVLADSSL